MALNSFYTPITADSIGDKLSQQQKDYESAHPTPIESGVVESTLQTFEKLKKEQPYNPFVGLEAGATELLKRTQTPANQSKGFLRKVGEDAVALGAGIPIALSHPIQTLKSLVTTEEQPIGGATVESLKQIFQPSFYKEHPGLAAVNTGTWIASVFTLGLSKVLSGIAEQGIKIAAREAATAGIEEATIKGALKNSTIKTATRQAFRTGETGIVRESIATSLMRKGVEETAAQSIANKAAESILADLAENANKLKIWDRGAHPLRTTAEAVGAVTEPIRLKVFGSPESTAAARLYGAEIVAKNPEAFAGIEQWAADQAIQRGLKDTIENRRMVMQEWKSGEWGHLSPEEQIANFQNYVKSTNFQRKLNQITGEIGVSSKFIPPHYIEAWKQSIKNSPIEQSVEGLLNELVDENKNLALYSKTLKEIIAKNPTKEALISALDTIEKQNVRTYISDSEAGKLAAQMEKETGYHSAFPPEGKKVIFAQEGIKTAERVSIPESAAGRTKLGKLVEKFGLSPSGGAESLEYLFQEQFTQNAIKELGGKYGTSIKVGTRTIPLEELYNYLNKKRHSIEEAKTGFIKTRYTVSDINAHDLIRLGVDKEVAADISKIARQSLEDIPFAQTGLAEGVVNLMRARVPGFNSFINLKFETHFNLNPFYAMRFWFKTEVLKAFRGVGVSFGEVLDNRIRNIVEKLPYGKKIFAPKVDLADIKLMSEEILYPLNKNIVDFASNPELISLEKSANIGSSIQSRNIFLRGLGYNIPYDATGMAIGIAEKYGMGLRDALGYKIENGIKKYNNPEIFNLIKETTQSVFHYDPGFLTSPLMKTINTIWFPARFETKVVAQTARWLSNLSPIYRTEIVSNWIHFSNWSQTEEGMAWRKKNANLWAGVLRYLLPYEAIGKTVGSALNGKLFGGNTGMIGGLPFGWLVNIMQDLALIPEEEQFNPVTGRPVKKQTPREIVSLATVSVALEDLLIHILPSIPTYTLFGGNVTPWNRFIRDNIKGALSAGKSVFTGETSKKEKRRLERQLKEVPPTYTRY